MTITSETFKLNNEYVAIGTQRGEQLTQSVDPGAFVVRRRTLGPVDHYDFNRRSFTGAQVTPVAPSTVPVYTDAWSLRDRNYALGGSYADYLDNVNP